MIYVFSQFWIFVALALAVGLVVGWTSWGKAGDRKLGWLKAGLIVFALGALAAWLKLLPGVAGLALEIALLLFFGYLVGCLIGTALRGALSSEAPGTARATTALAGAGAAAAGAAATSPSQQRAEAKARAKAEAEAKSKAKFAEEEAARAKAEAERVAREKAEAEAKAQREAELAAREAELAKTGATVRPAREFSVAKGDDLTWISAIGPYAESRLNEFGVRKFSQIAAWTPSNGRWVDEQLGAPGRVEREDWIGQAKLLALGQDTAHSRGVKAGAIRVDDAPKPAPKPAPQPETEAKTAAASTGDATKKAAVDRSASETAAAKTGAVLVAQKAGATPVDADAGKTVWKVPASAVMIARPVDATAGALAAGAAALAASASSAQAAPREALGAADAQGDHLATAGQDAQAAAAGREAEVRPAVVEVEPASASAAGEASAPRAPTTFAAATPRPEPGHGGLAPEPASNLVALGATDDAHDRPAQDEDATTADDLKWILGIGPVNERALNGLGVRRFAQIADWSPANARWVGSHLRFPGRIERERWIEQAKLLAAGVETEHARAVKAGDVDLARADDALDEAAAERFAASLPAMAARVENEESYGGARPLGLAGARDGKSDDLKLIKGIGKQNEERLHALGVWHFDQIAAWTPANVKWVGSYLAFPGRIDREKWIDQAVALAKGELTEFAKRVEAGDVPTSQN
jgi:predicted flap endonuclease-1-like 5' DNA nuclease